MAVWRRPSGRRAAAWAGLGYYARARNLHNCAKTVAGEHGGRFPDDEEQSAAASRHRRYTAAAIAAIAFDRPATVLDGNVERVMARLFARRETPLPGVKPKLRGSGGYLTRTRPGDYAQAVMDSAPPSALRASPDAAVLAHAGRAGGREIAETLPRKAAKAEKPTRRGYGVLADQSGGCRAAAPPAGSGLLGGMIEVPSSDWLERPAPELDAMRGQAPVKTAWRMLPGWSAIPLPTFTLNLV